MMSTVSLFTPFEKGDTGPAGPAGQNGANGTNGTNGNSNVIGTKSVSISNWTLNGVVYKADISATGITQDIVDRGLVSVFRKYADGQSPLPDINGPNVTNFDFELGVIGACTKPSGTFEKLNSTRAFLNASFMS